MGRCHRPEGWERARAGLGARTLPQSAADSAPRAPLGLAAETLRSSTCAHVVVELRAAEVLSAMAVPQLTLPARPHFCAIGTRADSPSVSKQPPFARRGRRLLEHLRALQRS